MSNAPRDDAPTPDRAPSRLPPTQVDMVTMTGDVAQTIRYETAPRFLAALRTVLIRTRADGREN